VPPDGQAGAQGFGAYDDTFYAMNGQTWTVGVSGQLDHIDLVTQAIGPAFGATLAVYRGARSLSLPGSQFLGQAVVSSSSMTYIGVSSFDFSSSGITARAGEILTLRMPPPSALCAPGVCPRGWSALFSFFPS